MTTRPWARPTSRRYCRDILKGIKARKKTRAQEAADKAKNDEDQAMSGCEFMDLPVHELMTDTQFNRTLINLARSPVADTDMDGLVHDLELMGVAENITNNTTTTIAMIMPKDKLEQNLQKSPFLKLPPEVRCSIYKHVILNIIEGAEAVAFTRQLAGRDCQSVSIREQINALPHTCRIFRKECVPIYEELSYPANDSKINELEDVLLNGYIPSNSGSLRRRSLWLKLWNDREINTYGLGSPWHESQVTGALCRMRAVGDIYGAVMRIDKNIESQEGRRSMAIATKQWEICIGVKNRLHDGEGVRTAFEAEVMSQAGVEIRHDEIAIMLRAYAEWFAVLKTVQRLDNRARAPGAILKSRSCQPVRRGRRWYR
jgi:hypothetical protein